MKNLNEFKEEILTKEKMSYVKGGVNYTIIGYRYDPTVDICYIDVEWEDGSITCELPLSGCDWSAINRPN